MTGLEMLGYAASLLVLATFCMRGMVSLRVLAIASNLAFIGYAALAGIHPVLLQHVMLLPMNAWRLAEAVRLRRQCLRMPASDMTASLTPPVARTRRVRAAPPLRPLRRRRASATHCTS